VLNLVNSILQMPIQRTLVGDHDHAIKNLLVLSCVKACEAVRQPGDTVSLAAAGRVLNQIVVTNFLGLRSLDKFADRIQLVIPGKNKCLFNLTAGSIGVDNLSLLTRFVPQRVGFRFAWLMLGKAWLEMKWRKVGKLSTVIAVGKMTRSIQTLLPDAKS
jgi:hypothetical protein